MAEYNLKRQNLLKTTKLQLEPEKNCFSKKDKYLSSIHPWYYVPGKSHLTQQRLTTKYDKESKRNKQNEENDIYFRKCYTQAKLFSNWQQNKPMLKYYHNESCSHYPLFFIGEEENNDALYSNCLEKMLQLTQSYNVCSLKYKENFVDCSVLINFLFNYLINVYKPLKEKRLHLLTEIKSYLGRTCFNSTRDPLRHVCFLIKELLYHYKKEIFNIMKLLRPIYKKNFLNELEKNESEQLNNLCFQIVDMYIQLNSIRNDNFQNMFNEEREKTWKQLRKLWNKEISLWDNLIMKLLYSNYLLIRKKLDSSLQTQKFYFQERLKNFDSLNSYVNEVKQDPVLQSILYQDINKLSEPSL